jgi:Mn2+/Fe2+ NRAMP family transporter
MIYQRFGKWWGAFSLFDLQAVNFLTLVTEFAAIALAVSHMGVSPHLGVPFAAVGLIAMVVTGSYLRWERITVFLCLLDLGWLIMAFKLRPTFGVLTHDTFVPGVPVGGLTASLTFLVIAIVGTTIAPWQLFFQQSCIADKNLRFSDLKWGRLDTFIGAVFTITVAACMMIIGDASKLHGIVFADPAQMANALHVFTGEGIRIGILLLMINAAVLGTTAISLSSAWAYGEVKGWAAQPAASVQAGEGFLRHIRGLRRTRGCPRAYSARAAATHHSERSSPGRNHSAVGHHLSSAFAER